MQDNKCSWLIVQALDRVDDKQQKIIEVSSLCIEYISGFLTYAHDYYYVIISITF